MKYVSIDIETTCLDPFPANILMVSMVLEDTNNIKPLKELPHFTCLVRPKIIVGQPYALALNQWILKALAGVETTSYPIYNDLEWVTPALKWLDEVCPGKVTFAGKNVAGFDMQFMPQEIKHRARHRMIDPGSVLINWTKDAVLSLPELLGRDVSHDALGDARDVIEVLRRTYPYLGNGD